MENLLNWLQMHNNLSISSWLEKRNGGLFVSGGLFSHNGGRCSAIFVRERSPGEIRKRLSVQIDKFCHLTRTLGRVPAYAQVYTAFLPGCNVVGAGQRASTIGCHWWTNRQGSRPPNISLYVHVPIQSCVLLYIPSWFLYTIIQSFYLRLSLSLIPFLPFLLFRWVGKRNERKRKSVGFFFRKERKKLLELEKLDGSQLGSRWFTNTRRASSHTHTRTAGHTNWTRRGGRLFSNIIMVVRLLLLLSPLSLS